MGIFSLFLLVVLSVVLEAANRTIKDPKGRTIGSVNCATSYCEYRDAKYQLVAVYYFRQNVTRDSKYRLVCDGDCGYALVHAANR